MNQQSAIQNTLDQPESAGHHLKYFRSTQLEEELSQLRRRRAALNGEIAAAETALKHDYDALATTGGNRQLEVATAANGTVMTLRGALSSLDDQIPAKERELAEAKATEQWEDAIERILPTVDAAAEAVRLYEEHAEAVNQVLSEHVPLMAEAYRAWEVARKEFVAEVRALIPGVTPRIGTDFYGALVTPPEAAQAADLLLEALEARCEAVRPVLAPVAGLSLCIDQSFKVALQEPYGSVPHSLAQSVVADQKNEEKKG
jgi:vacuolar-type H+-ATPase subunit I/STV1